MLLSSASGLGVKPCCPCAERRPCRGRRR